MGAARTSYHHGNLRATLLDNAERALEETGPAGLSLRELARLAGVSHGAPRQHFADKQALLDALARRGFEQLGTELDGVAVTGDTPFAARLAAFARAWVGFAVERPALLNLMFASTSRADESLRAAADRAFAPFSAVIVTARRSGDIRDEPDRVAMSILATLQGLAALITSGMSGDRAVDTLVTDTVETLIQGLRPR